MLITCAGDYKNKRTNRSYISDDVCIALFMKANDKNVSVALNLSKLENKTATMEANIMIPPVNLNNQLWLNFKQDKWMFKP